MSMFEKGNDNSWAQSPAVIRSEAGILTADAYGIGRRIAWDLATSQELAIRSALVRAAQEVNFNTRGKVLPGSLRLAVARSTFGLMMRTEEIAAHEALGLSVFLYGFQMVNDESIPHGEAEFRMDEDGREVVVFRFKKLFG